MSWRETLSPEVSLHALAGPHAGIITFTTTVKICSFLFTAFLDSGSTTSFVSSKVVHRAQLNIINHSPLQVTIADGRTLVTAAQCIDQPYEIQGYSFFTTFRVLDIKGYDIILGCDWIYQHSPVTLNFHTRELTLHIDGDRELILSDITLPNSHFLVDSSHMDKHIAPTNWSSIADIPCARCYSPSTHSTTSCSLFSLS